MLLLVVSLFAAVGWLHWEALRLQLHVEAAAQRQRGSLENLHPRITNADPSRLSTRPIHVVPPSTQRSTSERQGSPARLEPAAPRQRNVDGGCSAHDTGCIMAQLRSQLSFTGVGDGGCTSTDRDCREEYSQWLSSLSNDGATPSGIHLTFAEPQHDSAAPSLFDDDALVLSWTTVSDAVGECSMARLRAWTQSGGSGYERRSTSPGSARYSTCMSIRHGIALSVRLLLATS